MESTTGPGRPQGQEPGGSDAPARGPGAGANGTNGAKPRHDRLAGFTLADLAGIRNLLRGGSVIDWHRLYFEERGQVERFLRLNEFDPQDADDMARLEDLREQAVEYLERHLQMHIADEVAEGIPIPDLFLVASQKGKRRTQACVVLKTMHVLHHLAGRSLLTRLPTSAEEIFHIVEGKVLRTVEDMKSAGCAVVQFEWSRKHADSLVTKLLAKKESIAADVYDKLRFRMIAATEDELIFLLRELTQRLVPFNYVIPGQSVNDLIHFGNLVEGTPQLAPFAPELKHLASVAADRRPVVANEFSGPSYRVINFVADLPVRIDQHLCRTPGDPLFAENGTVVFVLTEFQIIDARNSVTNESGENSHERYKERQMTKVKARLMHGMKEE